MNEVSCRTPAPPHILEEYITLFNKYFSYKADSEDITDDELDEFQKYCFKNGSKELQEELKEELKEELESKEMNMIAYNTLDQEPFRGFIPTDVLSWLDSKHTESELATAYEIVNTRVSFLMHEIDEIDDSWADEAFEHWSTVEHLIFRHIITILENENNNSQAKHIIAGIGEHYIVKPFMERNGYHYDNGWWRLNCE